MVIIKNILKNNDNRWRACDRYNNIDIDLVRPENDYKDRGRGGGGTSSVAKLFLSYDDYYCPKSLYLDPT